MKLSPQLCIDIPAATTSDDTKECHLSSSNGVQTASIAPTSHYSALTKHIQPNERSPIKQTYRLRGDTIEILMDKDPTSTYGAIKVDPKTKIAEVDSNLEKACIEKCCDNSKTTVCESRGQHQHTGGLRNYIRKLSHWFSNRLTPKSSILPSSYNADFISEKSPQTDLNSKYSKRDYLTTTKSSLHSPSTLKSPISPPSYPVKSESFSLLFPKFGRFSCCFFLFITVFLTIVLFCGLTVMSFVVTRYMPSSRDCPVSLEVSALPTNSNSSTSASFRPSLYDSIPLNKLQVMGSHNSYHIAPPAGTFSSLIRPWQYTHPPLPQQFDMGVRSIELDIHLRDGEVEVYHLPYFDSRTTCQCFSECLLQIKTWSSQNPGHHPLYILLDSKYLWIESTGPTAYSIEEWYDSIENVVAGVFKPEQILKPDDIIADEPLSLREAILKKGWPKLGDVRGKMMFAFMLDDGWVMDSSSTSAKSKFFGRTSSPAQRPSFIETTKSRLLFPMTTNPDAPYASIVKFDSTVPNIGLINKYVKEGFITRTLGNEGLLENPLRWKVAIDAGTQVISGDSWDLINKWRTHASTMGIIAEVDRKLNVKCSPGMGRCPDGELKDDDGVWNM
ncbi:PLC-like phosphodiesterase [Paraphysoderma sedebokerense]|nr:PLC-like phosphodiesterase [Paraphysoderma sedebokerense]